MYNQAVLQSLPKAQKSVARFPAMLLEYDIDGKKDKPLWVFLVNPKSLEFSESAEYSKLQPASSNVPHKSYIGASGLTLRITDVVFDTWCLGKSLRPLIDGLRSLLKCSPQSNEYSPKVLMFRWGSKRFAPCVLTDISWKEEKLLSGEVAKIRLNLTLEEIPRPLTKAELQALEKKKQDLIIAQNDQSGFPKLPLTDRQVTTAKGFAKDLIAQNIDKFKPDIQAKLRKKDYALTVDKKSGNVEILSGGKNLGVILRSLGEKIVVNSKIVTVPVSKPLPDFK
jgi:hypothetical protein